ncbi:hypothetical protein HMPREF9134_01049 [Porphyromonas catoniae F0037]|uniref:Uncharacterized protein n=1 Tax=Porphyromonas catoniae F0037 TaxID=1127696 RepID=L1NCQ3_9PORP|nr:hypothetical protein HMPREF9134_01049 [Porphyromonas catoniae F0037]
MIRHGDRYKRGALYSFSKTHNLSFLNQRNTSSPTLTQPSINKEYTKAQEYRSTSYHNSLKRLTTTRLDDLP